MKLNRERNAIMKSGKMVGVISYVLIFLGIVYLMLFISDGGSYILAAILTGGGGVFLNRLSKKMKATEKRYRQYIALVVNHSKTSIDEIAPIAGVSYEEAVKDLQKMIEQGYFQGAYIDTAKRSIFVPAAQAHEIPIGSVALAGERIVVCLGCGANNKVTTQVGECEYCGSPIS